jgi:hypothetical protein
MAKQRQHQNLLDLDRPSHGRPLHSKPLVPMECKTNSFLQPQSALAPDLTDLKLERWPEGSLLIPLLNLSQTWPKDRLRGQQDRSK